MIEDHYPIQKGWIETGGGAPANLYRVAGEVHSVCVIGLIQVFHTEDDGAALKGHPVTILAYGRIGLEQVSRHVEVEFDGVVRRPASANREILPRSCAAR